MKATNKTPEILVTTDYGLFGKIIGNRAVNQGKVDQIVADVQAGFDFFKYCPIVVSDLEGRLEIVDGQHRFAALRILELPVYYVVADDIKLRDIARLNSRTSNWSTKDFLDCYIQLGFEDYSTLGSIAKKYQVRIGLLAPLLMSNAIAGRHKTQAMADFRDGLFKCNHVEETIELIELVDHLFGDYVFYRDPKLFSAVRQLAKMGLWDTEIMKQKLTSNKNMMDRQGSPKNYMYLLEQIYNVRNHKRIAIIN